MSFPHTINFDRNSADFISDVEYRFSLSGATTISVLPDLIRLKFDDDQVAVFQEIDIGIVTIEQLVANMFGDGSTGAPNWRSLGQFQMKTDERVENNLGAVSFFFDFGPYQFGPNESRFPRTSPAPVLPTDIVGEQVFGDYRITVNAAVNPVLRLLLADAGAEQMLTPRVLVTTGNPTGQRSATWGGWIETVDVVAGDGNEPEPPALPDLEDLLGDDLLWLDGPEALDNDAVLEWLRDEDGQTPRRVGLDEDGLAFDPADITLGINALLAQQGGGDSVEIDLAPIGAQPVPLDEPLYALSRGMYKIARDLGGLRGGIKGVAEGVDLVLDPKVKVSAVVKTITGEGPALLKKIPTGALGMATVAFASIDSALNGYQKYRETGDLDAAFAAGGRELLVNVATGLSGVVISRGVGVVAGAALAAVGAGAATAALPVLVTGFAVSVGVNLIFESQISEVSEGLVDRALSWRPRFWKAEETGNAPQDDLRGAAISSVEPASASSTMARDDQAGAHDLLAMIEAAQQRLGDIAWVYDADRNIMLKSLQDTVPELWTVIEAGLGLEDVRQPAQQELVTLGDSNDAYRYSGESDLYVDVIGGDNRIETGAGGDVIVTGTGDDTVNAGHGDDTIIVALGGDNVITGGDGADGFVFQQWYRLGAPRPDQGGLTTADVKRNEPQPNTVFIERWREIERFSTTRITDFRSGEDRIVVIGDRSFGTPGFDRLSIERRDDGAVIGLPWEGRIILEGFHGELGPDDFFFSTQNLFRGNFPLRPVPIFDGGAFTTGGAGQVSVIFRDALGLFIAPKSFSVQAENASSLQISGSSALDSRVTIRTPATSIAQDVLADGSWEFQLFDGRGASLGDASISAASAAGLGSGGAARGRLLALETRVRSAEDGMDVVGGSGDQTFVALGRGSLVDLRAGGDNRVLTGAGADTVIGGAGDDVILAGRGGNNRIDLSAGGNNRVNAGDGADTIIGGAGRDVIRPGRGDDFIDLRAGGDNFVFNLRGNSTILGGAGDDVIFGGIGDTRILAGGGNNRIVAGPGRDTIGFVQEPHETRLLDFRPGSDTLDFTGHDGVSGLDDLTLRQIGTSTIIDDGTGGRIVLAALAPDQIGDENFLF